MLNRRTLLVLGAGSSAEFGLPVGSALAADIREKLSFESDIGLTRGDPSVYEAFQRSGGDIQQFVDGARKIAEALPAFDSIDDCLHTHSHNRMGVLAGKMAIAQAIAAAESKSDVFGLWGTRRECELAREKLWNTWAGMLVKLLTKGVSRADYKLAFKNLKIVSFNYDRCIRSIFYHLIQSALDLDERQAIEAMADLDVYHAYGSLGPLPPWTRGGGGPGVAFGAQPLDLIQAAERLFLYTEPQDQPEGVAEVRRFVYEAEKVVFLGFGYHAQNMELLTRADKSPEPTFVYGTVLGESILSQNVFRQRVLNVVGPVRDIVFLDQSCSLFWKQTAMAIANE
jgi:hypothetical protein